MNTDISDDEFDAMVVRIRIEHFAESMMSAALCLFAAIMFLAQLLLVVMLLDESDVNAVLGPAFVTYDHIIIVLIILAVFNVVIALLHIHMRHMPESMAQRRAWERLK